MVHFLLRMVSRFFQNREWDILRSIILETACWLSLKIYFILFHRNRAHIILDFPKFSSITFQTMPMVLFLLLCCFWKNKQKKVIWWTLLHKLFWLEKQLRFSKDEVMRFKLVNLSKISFFNLRVLNTKTHKLKNEIFDKFTSLNRITSSLLKRSCFSSQNSLCKSVHHITCFCLFFQKQQRRRKSTMGMIWKVILENFGKSKIICARFLWKSM